MNFNKKITITLFIGIGMILLLEALLLPNSLEEFKLGLLIVLTCMTVCVDIINKPTKYIIRLITFINVCFVLMVIFFWFVNGPQSIGYLSFLCAIGALGYSLFDKF